MCIVAPIPIRIVWRMDKWIALVRTKLRELKLTQEKLAERVGASQGGVGHWLNKRRCITQKFSMMMLVMVMMMVLLLLLLLS